MKTLTVIILIVCMQNIATIEQKCSNKLNCSNVCIFGYRKNSQGCTTCSCCELPTCPTTCTAEYGYAYLPDGCVYCTCKTCPPADYPSSCKGAVTLITLDDGCTVYKCSKPTPTCPPRTCTWCKWGNETVLDSSGCIVCKCLPEPICKKIICPGDCPSKYRVHSYDSNGCKLCVCDMPICPIAKCPSNCQWGTENVKKGDCDECKCKLPVKPTCLPTKCPLCTWGTDIILNGDGCAVCKCLPEPKCKKPTCPTDCPSKYKMHTYDSNDCEICICDMPICPIAKCPSNCQWGTENVKKGDCDECKCKLPVKPTCLPTKCPLCLWGTDIVLDGAGCAICKCLPKPKCKKPICPSNCPPQYEVHKYDSDGCESCICDMPICPTLKCSNNCEWGTEIVKKDNCKVCQCKATPVCPVIDECKSTWRQCRVIKVNGKCDVCKCDQVCSRWCWAGFKTINGKKTCNCCRPKYCKPCRNGYENDQDGCKSCTCKNKDDSCPIRKCRYCKYGYKTDENGCQTCHCLNRDDDHKHGHGKHKKHGKKHGGKHGGKHGRRHGGKHGNKHGRRKGPKHG